MWSRGEGVTGEEKKKHMAMRLRERLLGLGGSANNSSKVSAPHMRALFLRALQLRAQGCLGPKLKEKSAARS